ncbi:GAF domain-containing protein [Sulfobacillus thermosulfidooxidans]|uniref:GAF domain-containing protein n=1 Tax=Sulfobacillus thermosulfidooxidans TaxID=28034 RepID=UPI0003F74550|nr:GAF domain-containing protein [Sulfobacillus thermosulfidooxidans]
MVQHEISPETLAKLLQIAKTLIARRDLDGVLHDILQSSLELIPGADFACVFLYDAEDNVLKPVGGVGFDMKVMKQVRLRPGESLTGKAFVARQPILLRTPKEIKAAQDNLSPEHDHLVREAVRRPTNPVRSSIAVPLIVGQETVGVLVIDNYDTDRDFNETDLAVAKALADHSAVAVANAKEHARRLAVSRDLQKTLHMQKQLLANLVSEENSLAGLARTLWRQIHSSVTVYDMSHQVLARVGEQGDIIHSYPIVAGRQVLGQLVIGGKTVDPIERAAIDQARVLFAIELLRRQAVEQERLHSQSDLFHRLLEGDQFAVNALIKSYHFSHPMWQMVLLARGDKALYQTRC